MNDIATKEIDIWDFEQRDVETLVEIEQADSSSTK